MPTQKPKRLTFDVEHELARIRAAESVSRPFIAGLPAGDSKVALTSLMVEIKDAQHLAYQAIIKVKRAAESI